MKFYLIRQGLYYAWGGSSDPSKEFKPFWSPYIWQTSLCYHRKVFMQVKRKILDATPFASVEHINGTIKVSLYGGDADSAQFIMLASVGAFDQ